MGIIESLFMNDEQKDISRWFKRAIWVVMLFLISGCYSWDELRYSVSGAVATAHVLSRSTPRIDSPVSDITIKYQFTDKAGKSHEFRIMTAQIDADRLIENDQFDVIYMPSNPQQHEPVARRRLFHVVIFLAMCATMIGFFITMHIDVKREAQRDKYRSRGSKP